ncbi:MAG: Type 4 prepilin-like protein leader peptide-processing enzyme [Parcubacteria group bacterium GW2011_GWD2_35_7]|nr:MAG: Type 4 prepilin-like protein leader peptide-processing enzyme [Parcubacteria group bacterium GW2011_GWD2_35_7]
MTFFLTIIFFILGLIIGSFLNVVIFRFNTERSFGGRSGCMTCQNKLCWYELIPLISFFALKGRCRNCKAKISIQYPIVELMSGLIFAGLFLKFQDIFYLALQALKSALLIRIPSGLTYRLQPEEFTL